MRGRSEGRSTLRELSRGAMTNRVRKRTKSRQNVSVVSTHGLTINTRSGVKKRAYRIVTRLAKDVDRAKIEPVILSAPDALVTRLSGENGDGD